MPEAEGQEGSESNRGRFCLHRRPPLRDQPGALTSLHRCSVAPISPGSLHLSPRASPVPACTALLAPSVPRGLGPSSSTPPQYPADRMEMTRPRSHGGARAGGDASADAVPWLARCRRLRFGSVTGVGRGFSPPEFSARRRSFRMPLGPLRRRRAPGGARGGAGPGRSGGCREFGSRRR